MNSRVIPAVHRSLRSHQRGITLFGLMFWAVFLGFFALVAMKVIPTINEYATIKRVVNKIAQEGGTSVSEVRAAFEKQKSIEYGISISAKDLDIGKENDKIVVKFAYDKEIELMDPVYLVIKYQGQSK
jgi:predicted amino acid racemase